jgi:hypothetical protein
MARPPTGFEGALLVSRTYSLRMRAPTRPYEGFQKRLSGRELLDLVARIRICALGRRGERERAFGNCSPSKNSRSIGAAARSAESWPDAAARFPGVAGANRLHKNPRHGPGSRPYKCRTLTDRCRSILRSHAREARGHPRALEEKTKAGHLPLLVAAQHGRPIPFGRVSAGAVREKADDGSLPLELRETWNRTGSYGAPRLALNWPKVTIVRLRHDG